jgi:hypothetical protein
VGAAALLILYRTFSVGRLEPPLKRRRRRAPSA